jgi:hypothetical protein
MRVPPAKSAFTLPPHNTWHVDDRPHIGIGGLTDGQRLSYYFEMEIVLRALHKYRSQHSSYIDEQMNRIDQLPTNR